MSTYVLIHGSYQGGWIWKPTAEELVKGGHTVYTPTLDGCAERSISVRPGITIKSQAEEISGLLNYQDLTDLILVATSTGGLVTCKVAELSRSRVKEIFRRCSCPTARGASSGYRCERSILSANNY